MENGGNGFTGGSKRPNGSNSDRSWDFWELGTSQLFHLTTTVTTTTPTAPNPLLFSPKRYNGHGRYPSLYAGVSQVHPDPHLTCLKLGKRNWFEDGPPLGERDVAGFPIGKRSKSYGAGIGPSSSSTASVPICQVEGCQMALANAKDYHRRHKVCEMHSKAPKVVVLGIEQRFCQQCSRFHVVSEFDDSKRSCRKRLAGHNERRRKNSNDSITRNPSQDSKSVSGRFSCIPSSTGRAFSLLSSKTASCISPDLSPLSSTAIHEMIAENRILAGQLLFDRAWHHHATDELGGAQLGPFSHSPHQHQVFTEPPERDRFQESGAHLTLDLMHPPSSPFGFLSGRSKSKEEEDECWEIWKFLERTPMV